MGGTETSWGSVSCWFHNPWELPPRCGCVQLYCNVQVIVWDQKINQEWVWGTSLAVQWLRLQASTAGNMGSTPGRGTKILHVMWCREREKKRSFTLYCWDNLDSVIESIRGLESETWQSEFQNHNFLSFSKNFSETSSFSSQREIIIFWLFHSTVTRIN